MTDDEYAAIWQSLNDPDAHASGGPYWLRELTRVEDQRAALEALTAVTFVLADRLGLPSSDSVEHVVYMAFESIREDAKARVSGVDRVVRAAEIADRAVSELVQ